ncbi:agmatine deiminase family protein [Psychromicrobium lacuslunae]|uniref:agmatine deiminase family protein n=1 Tax=Psychromicrobium lacuslunae TaxID=1618207 RepID=UPI00190180C4|nr:agmatine deiminase family protein [Psychromicrobium lacuslunae]
MSESDQPVRWLMPEEGVKHSATWMSLQVDDAIWGGKLGAAARRTLENIAETIARYEPVKALVASKGSSAPQLKNVELIEQSANDLWIRDTGPTFVRGGVESSPG